MNSYTAVQKVVLGQLVAGAEVETYKSKGRRCFSSDVDGLRGVLALTITMRALLNKEAISYTKEGKCFITNEGKRAVGLLVKPTYLD